jgi:hypothetical protein
MDGTAVYDVRRAGKPGILVRLRLTSGEAADLATAFERDGAETLEGLDK